MLIMPSLVMAFVAAMRTGDKVTGVYAGGAFIEIWKEKNRGSAFLAGSDDVPSPIPGAG